VFFSNSGSEANDTALMLATQYRRSHQVLALRNSYAGRSHAAIAVIGNRGWSATALSPIKELDQLALDHLLVATSFWLSLEGSSARGRPRRWSSARAPRRPPESGDWASDRRRFDSPS
jgi:hypothetical protein